ncbi:MAG: multiple sugar transport system permease protein [Actinomycetota bacterium]|nr:multiple sugar transport system permease protein [Actinomycetota bacterium]
MVAMAGYVLLPFWWMIVAATKDNEALFASAPLWFSGRFSLWSNLAELLARDDGVFGTWIANTVLYSAVSGVGATAVSVCAGYAFAVLRFPFRRILFALLLGLVMIPGTALVLPTYLLLSKIGLTDTIWAVILPSLLNPFGVYLMRVYAEDAVPEEMLEAARIDGAGELRILRSIALPVMRPAVVTVLLFSVVATWNNFFLPLVMLSDSRLFPLTVGMNSWYRAAVTGTGGETLFNLVVVGSVVAVLPLVVAFGVLQRHWRSGLTAGSLRG